MEEETLECEVCKEPFTIKKGILADISCPYCGMLIRELDNTKAQIAERPLAVKDITKSIRFHMKAVNASGFGLVIMDVANNEEKEEYAISHFTNKASVMPFLIGMSIMIGEITRRMNERATAGYIEPERFNVANEIDNLTGELCSLYGIKTIKTKHNEVEKG